VLLIRWHRSADTFQFGQWFKGRIYDHRCDLSPSGERLLYFAADYKKPYYSWTAVSRPPFLTALALWPKGDCWGGGGQFETENNILLNHRDGEMTLARSFRRPKFVKVAPFGAHSGWGEDSPLFEVTLQRDSWNLINPGKVIEHSFNSPVWFTFDPPEIWSKPNPTVKTLVLHRMLTGIHRRGGSTFVTEAAVLTKRATALRLGEIDWADWDTNGDLLYSQDGCLYRRRADKDSFYEPTCLLDLTDLRFRNLAPTSHPSGTALVTVRNFSEYRFGGKSSFSGRLGNSDTGNAGGIDRKASNVARDLLVGISLPRMVRDARVRLLWNIFLC
jgi:hypothetical protein